MVIMWNSMEYMQNMAKTNTVCGFVLELSTSLSDHNYVSNEMYTKLSNCNFPYKLEYVYSSESTCIDIWARLNWCIVLLCF